MIEVEIMFGNKHFNIDIQQCTRKNFIVIFLITRALVEIIRLHPDKIACHLVDNIT